MPLVHRLIAMASVADVEEEAATAAGVKRTEGGGGAVEDAVSILRSFLAATQCCLLNVGPRGRGDDSRGGAPGPATS